MENPTLLLIQLMVIMGIGTMMKMSQRMLHFVLHATKIDPPMKHFHVAVTSSVKSVQ
jgi:hypothetical protein